jgi:hypothetical protein
MVSLEKTVKLYAKFKRYIDGDWHIRAYWAKKTDSDISRVLEDLFKRDIPLNSPIQVIQPNWAGTGIDVVLVDYDPFQTIYTNRNHVRNVRNVRKTDKR